MTQTTRRRKEKPKLDRLEKTPEHLQFVPRSEKQRMVLNDLETDVLCVGGGAGGGKSFTCLMKSLIYIKDPAARVLIVRQSYPALKISGGLWDESFNVYPHFGGEAKIQRLTWQFPNGATIQFAAMPEKLSEWQGLQASHILVDESAEFKEDQIIFLLSRLRSAKYKGKTNLTLTCNPDNASFLFNWVKYSLDEDTGVPKVGTEHITNWFVSLNGKIYWGDSPESLYKEHGAGMTMGKDFIPKSFRFIPMTVHDNPVLVKNNPAYLANLQAQSHINKLRYLYGSWTAKDVGAMYFNRDWCEVVKFPPTNRVAAVRAWDLAGTERNPMSRDNPDYTAGVLLSKDAFGTYYVEDCVRFQKRIDGVLREIVETSKHDGSDVLVSIPEDPSASGKSTAVFMKKTLAENGVYSRTLKVSNQSSKLTRFKPLCALAESGNLKFVQGDYLEELLSEMENFTGQKSKNTLKDDQVDAISDAFMILAKTTIVPAMTIPSLTQASPIATY